MFKVNQLNCVFNIFNVYKDSNDNTVTDRMKEKTCEMHNYQRENYVHACPTERGRKVAMQRLFSPLGISLRLSS